MASLGSILLAALLVAQPSPKAEPKTPAEEPVPEKCRNLGVAAKGKKLVSGAINAVAGDKAERLGMKLFNPLLDVSSTLTNAIACQLNPAEQKQAATATNDALTIGRVGTKIKWTSASRANVSGSSEIEAIVAGPPTRQCLLVADVVIVDGEEARVQKRMCRGPGQPRYVLDA